MKVLLTGPFGNIGSSALQQLIRQGHEVRCFARRSKHNEQKARLYESKIELAWGDIRRAEDVIAAVQDQEVIIHLAAVIPPAVDEDLATAQQVNLEGTRTILQAAADAVQPPKILFSSSFDVFGYTQDQPPPRRVSDPIQATDEYTKQKIACEEMVKASGLAWSIYRFSDVPPLAPRKPHPIMYRIPLKTRMEILHTHDAGLAIANGLHSPIWGKILLLGGGKQCQIYYSEYVRRLMEAAGIGMLPEDAFGTEPFCSDWIDTEESQRLLAYQNHSFDDIVAELAQISAPKGVSKLLMPLLRPLVRSYILSLSPHIARKNVRREAVS